MSEPSTLEDTESAISFEEINTVTHVEPSENDTTNDHEMEQEDDEETQWNDPNEPNPVNGDENMVEDNLDTNNELEVDQTEESNVDLNNEREVEEEELEAENDENLPGEEEEEEELEEDSEQVPNEDDNDNENENDVPEKLSQLPISKIRRIMKICLNDDTGIKIVSKESAFLVGQATELFIAALAQQTAKITQHSKKKTMTMQHLTASIADSEEFAFLEGTMPEYDF